MKIGEFDYQYDHLTDEWLAKFDGNVILTENGYKVSRIAEESGQIEVHVFRMLVADNLLYLLEHEENGFFVSAVLTKLFNNGMNWTKEVK